MRAATLLYFLSYMVFSFSAKWLGSPHPDSPAIDGLALLPASMLCCAVVWLLGLGVEAAVAAYRRHHVIHHHRLDVVTELRHDGVYVTTGPHGLLPTSRLAAALPLLFTRDVLVAAVASAAILISSTLAYSTPQVSLLLPLLLMKGGVNLWGPVVSWLRGDGVTTRARLVLGLALAAVVAVLWNKLSLTASFAVGITVAYAAVYVAAYFPKLEVLSRYRSDGDFLVAEMTTTLIIALPLAVVVGWAHTWQQSHLAGAAGHVDVATLLRTLPHAVIASTASLGALLCKPLVWVMAVASEGAGLFGGLVFLAPVASTLSVPLNRCTSLLGGFVATVALWSLSHVGGVWSYVVASQNRPELVGVAAMILALWIGLGSRSGGSTAGRRQSSGEIIVPSSGPRGSVLEAATVS